MADRFEILPGIVDKIKAIQDVIITNIVLIGQIPAPTFKEKMRSQAFMERMAGFGVDECTTDGYRNPIAIVRGTQPENPPIFVTAHLDTFYSGRGLYDYTVTQHTITGPGLLDNSLGVGVLLSLPVLFKHLNLRFRSDIVLAGTIQSIGKGNLRGVRHLLKTWPAPIRAAVCLEGVELGRLNYFSDGMIRGEIECRVPEDTRGRDRRPPNAIVVLNEIINGILAMRLAQRPRTRIVLGRISGGADHGKTAVSAELGFEIRSDAYRIVKATYADIQDIVESVGHENDAAVRLKTISNLRAARLRFNHPLIKTAARILETLGVAPVSQSTESALAIFLAHKIPAVTLGISRGENPYTEAATMEIEPMFAGIAQIIGVLQAIDDGICDEHRMA